MTTNQDNNLSEKCSFWRKYILQICAFWAFFLLLLDQGTKFWAVEYFKDHAPIKVIPDFFSLTLVFNRGAAWGILSGQTWLLLSVALLVMVGMVVFLRYLTENYLERYIALAMIVSGIIGNSIDRVWRGAVVDFLDFDLGFYRWPTFNIADSAICIGVVIYFISAMFRRSNIKETPAAQENISSESHDR